MQELARLTDSPREGAEVNVARQSCAKVNPKADMASRKGLLDNAGPPEDKYHIAYWIFFSLGAGFLFPWNAFITAADYFGALYPNDHVDRIFPVAYMVPNILFLCLIIKYGSHYSSSSRVYLGFSCFLVVLLGMPILDVLVVHGGHGTRSSLFVTVAALFFTGILDAIVQGSLFGAAGELPETYTQALTGGTSASGLIVSLLRCFTKVAFPNNKAGMRASAALYFLISAGFVAACLVSYSRLHSVPIIQYYRKKRFALETKVEEEAQPKGPLEESRLLSTESSVAEERISYRVVWRKIWKDSVLVMLVYWVTLTIFPGFMAEDVHSDVLGDWYPVLLITIYNLFDFLGKMGPTKVLITDEKVIQISTLARLLFLPAFVVCLNGPLLLRTEPVVLLLTCSLGLTNGYLTSILMMFAPKRVPVQEAETAGTLMVFSLVLGLTLGAFSGWLWLI